jgi:heme-degrading monooxygenase HmoA
MADETTTESGLPSLGPDGLPQPESWLSVLQFFVKERNREDFEEELGEMYELAKKQPGFLWGHYGRSMIDGRYFVISEWESRPEMKAWEEEERHQQVMEDSKLRYEPGRDAQNRKFIPWYKPGAERKPWTT